ncbi:GNAT family N-acetyltransferase [Babesia caballi]|uniref:GNAT family N-acetyltransferase n=1 Tax=Babesia caballi TaxID=5871 RepID=A0AAV4M2G1_BABCB|nr:GNAT family N-acetyltransferase [Babesia caballi]
MKLAVPGEGAPGESRMADLLDDICGAAANSNDKCVIRYAILRDQAGAADALPRLGSSPSLGRDECENIDVEYGYVSLLSSRLSLEEAIGEISRHRKSEKARKGRGTHDDAVDALLGWTSYEARGPRQTPAGAGDQVRRGSWPGGSKSVSRDQKELDLFGDWGTPRVTGERGHVAGGVREFDPFGDDGSAISVETDWFAEFTDVLIGPEDESRQQSSDGNTGGERYWPTSAGENREGGNSRAEDEDIVLDDLVVYAKTNLIDCIDEVGGAGDAEAVARGGPSQSHRDCDDAYAMWVPVKHPCEPLQCYKDGEIHLKMLHRTRNRPGEWRSMISQEIDRLMPPLESTALVGDREVSGDNSDHTEVTRSSANTGQSSGNETEEERAPGHGDEFRSLLDESFRNDSFLDFQTTGVWRNEGDGNPVEKRSAGAPGSGKRATPWAYKRTTDAGAVAGRKVDADGHRRVRGRQKRSQEALQDCAARLPPGQTHAVRLADGPQGAADNAGAARGVVEPRVNHGREPLRHSRSILTRAKTRFSRGDLLPRMVQGAGAASLVGPAVANGAHGLAGHVPQKLVARSLHGLDEHAQRLREGVKADASGYLVSVAVGDLQYDLVVNAQHHATGELADAVDQQSHGLLGDVGGGALRGGERGEGQTNLHGVVERPSERKLVENGEAVAEGAHGHGLAVLHALVPGGDAAEVAEERVVDFASLAHAQLHAVAALRVAAEASQRHAENQTEVHGLGQLPLVLGDLGHGLALDEAGRQRVEVLPAGVGLNHLAVLGDVGGDAQLDLGEVGDDELVAGVGHKALAETAVARNLLQVGVVAAEPAAFRADLVDVGVDAAGRGVDVVGDLLGEGGDGLVGLAVVAERGDGGVVGVPGERALGGVLDQHAARLVHHLELLERLEQLALGVVVEIGVRLESVTIDPDAVLLHLADGQDALVLDGGDGVQALVLQLLLEHEVEGEEHGGVAGGVDHLLLKERLERPVGKLLGLVQREVEVALGDVAELAAPVEARRAEQLRGDHGVEDGARHGQAVEGQEVDVELAVVEHLHGRRAQQRPEPPAVAERLDGELEDVEDHGGVVGRRDLQEADAVGSVAEAGGLDVQRAELRVLEERGETLQQLGVTYIDQALGEQIVAALGERVDGQVHAA